MSALILNERTQPLLLPWSRVPWRSATQSKSCATGEHVRLVGGRAILPRPERRGIRAVFLWWRPDLIPHACGNLAEHGRQLVWSWTMQTMNTTRRNLEQECGFIEPGTFQDTVDRSVSQAPFKHGSTVGTEKLCCGGLEPLAHRSAVI